MLITDILGVWINTEDIKAVSGINLKPDFSVHLSGVLGQIKLTYGTMEEAHAVRARVVLQLGNHSEYGEVMAHLQNEVKAKQLDVKKYKTYLNNFTGRVGERRVD